MASAYWLPAIIVNDYVFLVIATAVGYDYILTFSEEVEYIWNQPWTRVSTLFILARYFGLFYVIISYSAGTFFLPGPAWMYVFVMPTLTDSVSEQMAVIQGSLIFILTTWALWIFVSSADLVMILRVWALYGQSRLVLCTLLACYSIEVISYLIFCIKISAEGHTSLTIQVLDSSFCATYFFPPAWPRTIDTVQMTLGVIICSLTAFQFIRELYRMYKVTKRFQLNSYMNVLMRDGIVYFLIILTSTLLNELYSTDTISEEGLGLLPIILEAVPPIALFPRFFINLRKLYAQDLRGRQGADIDAAFGLTSTSSHGRVPSTIVFADGGQNEETDQGEEIRMVERETHETSSA